MTENEAKEYMENEVECIKRASHCDRDCLNCELVKEEEPLIESYGMAIQALEEIQQYRAIGTVEDMQQKDEVIATQTDIINGVYKDYEKYLKIGTIDEFKALKEKSVAKKPITYTHTHRADCPNCRATVRGIDKPFGDYCSKCGTKIDWSE